MKHYTSFIHLFVLIQVFASCASNGIYEFDPNGATQCTFNNPIAEGEDPWVIRKDGNFFFIESEHRGLYISKLENLTDIKNHRERVWDQPSQGWNAALFMERGWISGFWNTGTTRNFPAKTGR